MKTFTITHVKNIFLAGYMSCQGGRSLMEAKTWFTKTYLKELSEPVTDEMINKKYPINLNPHSKDEQELNTSHADQREAAKWMRSQVKSIDLEKELRKFRNFWNKKNYVSSKMDLSDLKEYLKQYK